MTKSISALFLLAFALGLMPGGVNAQQPQGAAPAAALPDTNGSTSTGGVAPLAAVGASPSTACLQLHLGATVFNFNLNINADVYPYAITGGSITGSICQAPWTVTGGSLSNNLAIQGQHAPVTGCSTTISVMGTFDNPSSWIGTYGFNGSSTMFSHHTLFLGYNRPSCP
jgi:hypothetical protein